jgi:hypothetical protein
MDRPEPERQLWLEWRCHIRHNLALICARKKQVKCINRLLACACGPELASSLADRLQPLSRLQLVNPQELAAVMSKVRSRAGAQPDNVAA